MGDEVLVFPGHGAGSVNIFSGYLEKRVNELPKNRQIIIVCNIGNRASLAASILTRAGIRNVHNVLGGIIAWKNAGFEITASQMSAQGEEIKA